HSSRPWGLCCFKRCNFQSTSTEGKKRYSEYWFVAGAKFCCCYHSMKRSQSLSHLRPYGLHLPFICDHWYFLLEFVVMDIFECK
ncbi:hypothetical protein GIB67_016180, partial [Kingdonia uniflora]